MTLNMSGDLTVSYAIRIQGKKLIISLEKVILPDDFQNSTHDNKLMLRSDVPHNKSDCFYKGHIVNVPNSSVTLTTCSGLRGLLHAGNMSYRIEPLNNSQFKHLIYPLMSISRDMQSFAENNTALQRRTQGFLKERFSFAYWLQLEIPLLKREKMVILYMVMDRNTFQHLGMSKVDVLKNLLIMAKYLNFLYYDLTILMLLKGVEIWDDEDKISLEGSGSEILSRFLVWEQNDLLPRIQHDVAFLMVYRPNSMSAGKVTFGGICSHSAAGVIFEPYATKKYKDFARVLAHMMGHTMGFNHDDGRVCTCEENVCLMETKAFVNLTTYVSSCTMADFEVFLSKKKGQCLLESRDNSAPGRPICMDYLKQVGEGCDCDDNTNCNGRGQCCLMCDLFKGATCSFGECCINCQPIAKSLCRATISECDLPEFCDGSSPSCPPDLFMQNGSPCSKTNYCYKGLCQSHDSQCKKVFGEDARACSPEYFEAINTRNDRFGHCGATYKSEIICEKGDELCGKLLCDYTGSKPLKNFEGAVMYHNVGRKKCISIDYEHEWDIADPLMVEDGTACGPHKICLSFKCVDLFNLIKDQNCTAEVTCHRRGVCNSKGNCHCFDGWKPPYCIVRGSGGSIDSERLVDTDTTYKFLNVWLLLGFCIIFPLLLLVINLLVKACHIAFRRHQMKKKQSMQSTKSVSEPGQHSSQETDESEQSASA